MIDSSSTRPRPEPLEEIGRYGVAGGAGHGHDGPDDDQQDDQAGGHSGGEPWHGLHGGSS